MSEAQQSDGTPLPPDTPVDAARRRAFDHPTIDNLRDLEAVATAQSDAARVAAEERAHQMEVWGSEKVVGDLERLIEILGPWHDDESCDSFADLVGEVESRLRAAEARIVELETDIAHGITTDAAKMAPRLAAAEAVVEAAEAIEAQQRYGSYLNENPFDRLFPALDAYRKAHP